MDLQVGSDSDNIVSIYFFLKDSPQTIQIVEEKSEFILKSYL